MQIKVFKAGNMKDAMAAMKAELGEDAVILHSKKYKEGGLLGIGSREVVEITAAVEETSMPRRKETPRLTHPTVKPNSLLTRYKTDGTAQGVERAAENERRTRPTLFNGTQSRSMQIDGLAEKVSAQKTQTAEKNFEDVFESAREDKFTVDLKSDESETVPSYAQSVAENSPPVAEKTPVETRLAGKAPIKNSPVKNSPAKNSSADNSTVENSPAKNSPADNSPTDNSPAENSSAKNSPAENSSAKNSPADNSPVDNFPADNSSAKNSPADNSPADNFPADNSPADNSPAENSPIENSPAKNSPIENSLADNSLADNSPAKNSPDENSPANNSSANNSPANNSSANNSPANNSSANNSPAENSPTKNSPIENSPAKNSPIENSPVENSPAENSPAENSPADNSPVKNSPADNSPTENSPADNSPVKNSPADNPPAENAPADNSPADNSPADNSPVKNSPTDNSPTDNSPADNSPADNSPAENPPTENSPADNSPAENPPADNSPAGTQPVATFTQEQMAQTQAMIMAQFNQMQMMQQAAIAQVQAQAAEQIRLQQQATEAQQAVLAQQTAIAQQAAEAQQAALSQQVTPPDTQSEEKIKRLEEEIAQMKALLAEVLGRDSKKGTISLHEAMRLQEVDEDILTEMATQANAGETLVDIHTPVAKATLINYLNEHVKFSDGVKLNRHGVRIVALLGTTGVGKTTTLAKIAAKFVLEQRTNVALVTADTYRISAVEQLKTYSDILELPLEIVYNPAELASSIERHRDKELILIDTAGRSQHNEYQMRELEEFLRVNPRIEKHLVISATTKLTDARQIMNKFSQVEPDKIIFTKIDETGTLGMIVNLLRDNKYSLSYITTGQSVPDDIERASADVLTNLLLKKVEEQ